MKYWLMRSPIHGTDINAIYEGKPWTYFKVYLNGRLQSGDVVYLGGAYGDVYAWGLSPKPKSTVMRPVSR